MSPNVVVAEANRLVLFSLVWAVKKAFGREPAVLVTTPEETWVICQKAAPDILILDFNLGEQESFDLIRKIIGASPSTRILVTSDSTDQDQIYKVIQEGVFGYFNTKGNPQQLVLALHDISLGKRYLCPVAIEALSNQLHLERPLKPAFELTPRERELLKSFALGKSVKETATALQISQKTVYTHRAAILQKTQCKDNVGLTHYAFKHGIITH